MHAVVGGREGPSLEWNGRAGGDRRGPGRGTQRQGCLKDSEHRPPTNWSPGVRSRSVAARQQRHPRASWHLVRRAGFKPSWSRWEPTSLLKHYLNWQFQQRGPRTSEDHYWVQLHPLRCAVSIYQGATDVFITRSEAASLPSVISPLCRSMAKSSGRPCPCVGQASPCSCKRQAHGPLPGPTGQLGLQQDSALPPMPTPSRASSPALGHVLPEEALSRAGTLSPRRAFDP